jgi:hypothetical protein
MYPMTDTPESNRDQARQNLASEFHNLGENLKKMFINAWESEERKIFQKELEEGLNDVGDSLKQTAQEFKDSESGQKMRAEAEELRDRIQSGEVAEKIHQDLIAVLQKVNAELEKSVPSEPAAPDSEGEGPGN